MLIDGDMLIVAETFAGRLTAFTIGAGGSLSHGRVWGQIASAVEPRPVAEMVPQLGFAPAPDFIEANRKDVREACLFTTTVDVPHRGLP